MATLAPENVRTDTRTAVGDREARQARSRRFRAILAGGLVLGVGAAVTLAAWNDSEFAQGTFTAGQFNLEGSTDGSVFAEHAVVGSPATLGFSVDPTNLSPGDSVTAAFAVRLDATTTTPADLAISASPATGTILPNLTYQLDQTAAFGCDLSGADSLVAAGTAIDAVVTPPVVELADGDGVAGTPAYFCFTVTAGAGLQQTQTGTATWQFAATSTE
jgi:predicted ribosomally synthesized peptide with SipW-like signal peptide